MTETRLQATQDQELTEAPPVYRHGIPAPTKFSCPDTGFKFNVHNGKYSDKVARQICERLMCGDSLKEVGANPRMPSKRTIIRWLADPRMTDFREMYYYARRVAAEIHIDEILEIADDTSKDWKKKFHKQRDGEEEGENFTWVPDNEAIQRSRVRIDTRKWYAAKMVPRLYGEKSSVDLDVTGDLAELLKSATNKDEGLPEPIENDG